MKLHQAHAVHDNEVLNHQLYEAITAIKAVEEAEKFFQDLCTPMEIQAMADRWRVVPLVKAGKPYRQIYEETGVSVTTVGRVARCMMLGTGGYNIIYERIEKKANENISKTKSRNPKKRSS